MNLPRHYLGAHERSVTCKWIGSDSVEQFDIHMNDPIKRKQLAELGYDENSIEYTFNEYGFRTDPFPDHNNTIMFLGCSHTQGMGLRYEDVYATKVAKELGLHCINLGVGGRSDDTSFRLASYWVQKLQPKILVHQSTYRSRFEIPFHQNFIVLASYNSRFLNDREYTTRRDKVYIGETHKHSVMHPNHFDILHDKNMYAIKGICNTFGVKHFFFDYNQMETEFEPSDHARDLGHQGVKSHQQLAEHVIQLITGYK